jgi:hypothetical protein
MRLQIIFYLSLILTSGCAFRFGGRAERLCATILVAGSLLSVAVIDYFHHDWMHSAPFILLIDTAALAAFVAIALTSHKFWPLWAAGFQLPGVITHIAIMTDPHIVPKSYALAQGFWVYPIMISLVIGIRAHRQPVAVASFDDGNNA